MLRNPTQPPSPLHHHHLLHLLHFLHLLHLLYLHLHPHLPPLPSSKNHPVLPSPTSAHSLLFCASTLSASPPYGTRPASSSLVLHTPPSTACTDLHFTHSSHCSALPCLTTFPPERFSPGSRPPHSSSTPSFLLPCATWPSGLVSLKALGSSIPREACFSSRRHPSSCISGSTSTIRPTLCSCCPPLLLPVTLPFLPSWPFASVSS